jgi:hypothetical protein
MSASSAESNASKVLSMPDVLEEVAITRKSRRTPQRGSVLVTTGAFP